MGKKVLTWGGIAFLIFFIAYRPSTARDVFASLGNTVADIWDAGSTWFKDLIG